MFTGRHPEGGGSVASSATCSAKKVSIQTSISRQNKLRSDIRKVATLAAAAMLLTRTNAHVGQTLRNLPVGGIAQVKLVSPGWIFRAEAPHTCVDAANEQLVRASLSKGF
jgi:hypothetical protein